MKKLLKILLLIFILCLSGCNVEQTENIYIVYTNDVGGEVNGEIGYAGVKGYLDSLKKEKKYVSLVDSGDFLEGNLAIKTNGEAIVDIMNAVGYDVVALGNQEFSLGLDVLSSAANRSKFPFVSCNIKYLGKGRNPLRKVKPYVIKRYGWTKIAFIGVVTPETILRDGKPAYNAVTNNGEPLFYFYEDNEGQALYDQIQKTVDKVRDRVDYVILLAHLGSNSTIEGFNSYDVISHTNGIDVVIDGHSHTVISGEGVPNKDGTMVVLTSTGEKLQNVGVLDISPEHTYTTVLYPIIYEKDESLQGLIDSLVEKSQ